MHFALENYNYQVERRESYNARWQPGEGRPPADGRRVSFLRSPNRGGGNSRYPKQGRVMTVGDTSDPETILDDGEESEN